LTSSKSLAHFATLLVRKLTFSFHQNSFTLQQTSRADEALSIAPSPSGVRCASPSMRLLITITLLLLGTQCFSQDNGLIKLAFKDKSNFDITTLLNNKKPTVYYVLNKTDIWNTCRFHIDQDLSSEIVRKELERDEHSAYTYCYIFKDTTVNKLFNEKEKQHLYQISKSIKPRLLVDTFKLFKLIKSYEKAKNGFFFSVTEPIFSTDNQFAFLDITTFKKNKDTEELRFAYFGHTFLIYQNLKEKGWTRIKKIDYLVL
jgi:hypothetical protein